MHFISHEHQFREIMYKDDVQLPFWLLCLMDVAWVNGFVEIDGSRRWVDDAVIARCTHDWLFEGIQLIFFPWWLIWKRKLWILLAFYSERGKRKGTFLRRRNTDFNFSLVHRLTYNCSFSARRDYRYRFHLSIRERVILILIECVMTVNNLS